LALKALEAEFAGKVKCVFIDPPYNTGVRSPTMTMGWSIRSGWG
jgi:16S rRNA G966 N2-methylase RsmD